MFNNVGGKIKKLAKFCAYGFLIYCVLASAFGLIQYLGNKDCIQYASIYGGSSYESLTEAGNRAYNGLQMFKYGLIIGIGGVISAWPMYGFGELIESTAEIRDALKAQQNTSSFHFSTSGVRVPSSTSQEEQTYDEEEEIPEI